MKTLKSWIGIFSSLLGGEGPGSAYAPRLFGTRGGGIADSKHNSYFPKGLYQSLEIFEKKKTERTKICAVILQHYLKSKWN